MSNVIFIQEEYDRYDMSAKLKLKEIFHNNPKYKEFELVEPKNEKIVDFFVYKEGKHVANIEVEVKTNWKTFEFKFPDVQILPRKKKYWTDPHFNQNKPTMMVMFNNDLSNHMVFSDKVMKACYMNDNTRSYSSSRSRGDSFYVIDIKDAMMSEFTKPNIDTINEKSTHETELPIAAKSKNTVENPVYSHVYHDRNTDDIYVWYTDGSRKKYKTLHNFYTPNQGEYGAVKSGMRDIYGNPVYSAFVTGKDEYDIKSRHMGENNHLYEIDIDYRTRWIQNHYAKQGDLVFGENDFNKCFLDIEVETGTKFSQPEDAIYPINVITLYFSKQDTYVTLGLYRDLKDETIERLKTINQYLLVSDNCIADGKSAESVYKSFKLSSISNGIDVEDIKSIKQSDVARVFNKILCSNNLRDKLLLNVHDKGLNYLPENLSTYINKLHLYEKEKEQRFFELKKIKHELNGLPSKHKIEQTKKYRLKVDEFKNWSVQQESTLKQERRQKRAVRYILEKMFGVIKDVHPKNSGFVYKNCKTEKSLLETAYKVISDMETDFISGWNSQGYDFPYMFKRSEIVNADTTLMSRIKTGSHSIRRCSIAKEKKKFKNIPYYPLYITGSTIWDYMLLYRMYSRSEKDNLKLDTIGRDEIGDQKIPMSHGFSTYKHNWDEWVEYNVQDVNILVKLDKKMKLIETSVGVCTQARIPYDGIWETKKIIVGFLLDYLHKQNIVMPPLKQHPTLSFPGAFVFSKPGHKKHLVSFDYRSMYPSIDMSGNVSIEKKYKFPDGVIPTKEQLENLVVSPVEGVYFKKDSVGIIPSVMKELFDGRKAIKDEMKRAIREGRMHDAAYLDMKQNAYKLFGNSLYGLLGLKYFQFYDKECAHSITAFGVDLIKYTITQVSDYFDNELIDDIRFYKAFGEKPNLSNDIKKFDRFSHGDTDSFFIRFEDIYTPFESRVEKTLDIVKIVDGELKYRESFDLTKGESNAMDKFKELVTELDSHSDMDNESLENLFSKDEGMVISNGTWIIVNRHTLTDFCRVFDGVLFNRLLSDVMERFANKWNCIRNEFFLKREKCILGAMVVAKKRYICNVESNEDAKYKKPKEATTGLEIVRSTTAPFSRVHLKRLAKEIIENFDPENIKSIYREVKADFYKHIERNDIYPISIPTGIGKDAPDIHDAMYEKGIYFANVAGSVWNHLIENDPILSKEGHQPIVASSKVKLLKVDHRNPWKTKHIAYLGDECPDRILEIFRVDWELQFETIFESATRLWLEALGLNKNLLQDNKSELEMF